MRSSMRGNALDSTASETANMIAAPTPCAARAVLSIVIDCAAAHTSEVAVNTPRPAQNIRRREEAERLSERMSGLTVVIIRQAGESGSLYGSVSSRDIADACAAASLTVNRNQVVLDQPIKTLGLTQVRLVLHPEVTLPVTVNVARSPEEAEKQARGEQVGLAGEEDVEPDEVLEYGAALAEAGGDRDRDRQ